MKKEWISAIGAFTAFAVSFELVRRLINDVIMEGIFKDKIINGGFIVALEMGLISVLAISCSNSNSSAPGSSLSLRGASATKQSRF